MIVKLGSLRVCINRVVSGPVAQNVIQPRHRIAMDGLNSAGLGPKRVAASTSLYWGRDIQRVTWRSGGYMVVDRILRYAVLAVVLLA